MGRFPRFAAFVVAIVALVTTAYTTTAFADEPIITKASPAETPAPWPTPAIAPLPFAPPTDPCKSAWDWATTKCQLTWHGVRAYGVIDAGGGYETKGVPFNGTAVYGSEYIIQKNSNRALWTLAPNALNNSAIGVQAFEPFAPGWAFVFDYSLYFDPESPQLQNGIGSIYENRGVPLASQTANYDSSRNGQPWNNTAYIGVSSPTYGTLTVFRQWALTLDAVYAYDPMAASNAFSLIGFSGTTCGVGDTEGCRATTAAKYRVQVGPVRLAALGQFGGYDLNNASNGGAQAEIGADIPLVGPGVLSFDAIYSYMRDAVSIAITATPPYPLTATLSNDQSVMLVAKWIWGPLRVYAGFEWIQYAPPSDPQTQFFNQADICTGTPCGNNTTISNAAYNAGDKTLDVVWAGARYTVVKDVDLVVAYYHYTQPTYGVGCTSSTAVTCFGTEDVLSGLIDWQFLPKWDTYIGTVFSQVNGALSSGYLASNTLVTVAGVRLRF
jgi:predicted porin